MDTCGGEAARVRGGPVNNGAPCQVTGLRSETELLELEVTRTMTPDLYNVYRNGDGRPIVKRQKKNTSVLIGVPSRRPPPSPGIARDF